MECRHGHRPVRYSGTPEEPLPPPAGAVLTPAGRPSSDESPPPADCSWNIAILTATEPGRRNRRTIDSVFLLAAAIVDRADGGDRVVGASEGRKRCRGADDRARVGGRALAHGVRRSSRARARDRRRRAAAATLGPGTRSARRSAAPRRRRFRPGRCRRVRLDSRSRRTCCRDGATPSSGWPRRLRCSSSPARSSSARSALLADVAHPARGAGCRRDRRGAAVRGSRALWPSVSARVRSCDSSSARRQVCRRQRDVRERAGRARGRGRAICAPAAQQRVGSAEYVGHDARRPPAEGARARPRRAGHRSGSPGAGGCSPTAIRHGASRSAGWSRSSTRRSRRSWPRRPASGCRRSSSPPSARTATRLVVTRQPDVEPLEAPSADQVSDATLEEPLASKSPGSTRRASPTAGSTRATSSSSTTARCWSTSRRRDARRAAVGARHRRGRAPRRVHRPRRPGARARPRRRRRLGRRDRARAALPPAGGADPAPP